MCGSVAFCHIPYGTFTCIYNRLVLHYIPQLNCRISTSVVCRLPKPKRRVRFPYPAPSSSRTVYRSRRFFIQKSSLIHFVAPTLQTAPAYAGLRFGFWQTFWPGTSILFDHHKKKGTTNVVPFFLGSAPPLSSKNSDRIAVAVFCIFNPTKQTGWEPPVFYEKEYRAGRRSFPRDCGC